MINCIIIDDEPLAVRLLESYVEKIAYLSMTASFNDPIQALGHLQNNHPDLIFLDIQMPQLNGIQFAKVIRNSSKIIFTTAYPDYAVDGFEIQALDYLIKPISFDRFLQAISRINISHTTTDSGPSSDKDYIFVKTEYRLQMISLQNIIYLKGMGDYCAIYTSDKKIMTLENMKSFEKRLPTSNFIRVHKSYIVALNKIQFIEKNRIVIGKERIPIGASYERRFKDLLA